MNGKAVLRFRSEGDFTSLDAITGSLNAVTAVQVRSSKTLLSATYLRL